MRNLILAVLLSVASAGCAERAEMGPTDTVGISTNFSAEETEQILAASDEWKLATNGAISLDMRIGLEAVQHSIVAARYLGGLSGKTLKPTDGRANVTIQLLGGLPSAVLKQVTMHELGHALGLDHAEEGIMRERFNDDQPCLTEEDARKMCDVIGCPNGWRGTCEE